MPDASQLLPVYRRLLTSGDPLPAHLIHRLLADLTAEDPLCAHLIARPEVAAGTAAQLILAAGAPAPAVAANYLTRPDVTGPAAAAAAEVLAPEAAAAVAGRAPSRAVHVELLRTQAGDPATLVALAGNDAVDLATRHTALTALDGPGRPLPGDGVRASIRLLPPHVRARAAAAVNAWWLLADLTDNPLEDAVSVGVACRLLRRSHSGREATAPFAATTAATLHRITAYLGPSAAAQLSPVVATSALRPADRATLLLTLIPDGPVLTHRLGQLPWPALLDAVDDDAVWAVAGAELSALLTCAETAAVLATLPAELTGTVAEVLAAVEGITAAAR